MGQDPEMGCGWGASGRGRRRLGYRPPPEVGFPLMAGANAARQSRRMIKRSLNQNYRAAALVGAAVVLSTVTAARAQAQALTNLFGGATSSAAATASETALGGNTSSGPVALGAGYTGTTTIPTGVIASVSETVNAPGTPSAFVLSATGVTLGSTFDVNKTFANAGLLPNTAYNLTFTSTNPGAANLLSSAGFVLASNGTPVANTISGFGIAGSANVLGVLDNGGTTTVTFDTPASLTAASPLTLDFEGNLNATVGVSNPTLEVSGASITPVVPEPGTLAPACLGLFAVACWRACRRNRFE